jgi:hypothetical protein
LIVKGKPPYVLFQRNTNEKEASTSAGVKQYKTVMYKVNPWLGWLDKKTQEEEIGFCTCEGFAYRKQCQHIEIVKEKLSKHSLKFFSRTYEEADLWIAINRSLDLIPKKIIKNYLEDKINHEKITTTKSYQVIKYKNNWLIKHSHRLEKSLSSDIQDIKTLLKLYKLKYN